MPKKNNYEEVYENYKKFDCELLESEYVDCRKLMKFKCKCGSIYEKPYYAFLKHPNCNNCGKTCSNSDKVKEFYLKHGCELLDEYTNNNKKMKFKCKCGNISFTCYKTFERSKQCKQCSGLNTYTIEKVKEIFVKENCILLETEYKNSRTRMNYMCSCGRQSKICLTKFKMGSRCADCGIRSGPKNGRWNPNRELVKLNITISSRSHSHLKRTLNNKTNHLSIYFGYSTSELRDRLTNHPNWNLVKDKKWHIDHIYPVKAFLEHNITDLKIINSLDNLQPLLGKDNLTKRDKYNKKAFTNWLNTKGIKC